MDLETMKLNANNCTLRIDSPAGPLLDIRLEFLPDIITYAGGNVVLDFVYNPLVQVDETLVRSTEVRHYKLILERFD